ncbi:MAG: HD domain-containing protein [Clostridia bacterium]|nr:HD domain-containing protein [Clostridia bacterium]
MDKDCSNNTTSKRLSQIVKRSELVNQIIESTPAAFVVLDRSFNILFSNEYVHSITGYSETEILNKKCFTIFGDGNICPQCAALKCLNSSKKESFLKCEKDKHGNTKYVEVLAVPLSFKSGKVEKILEIVIDRTDEVALHKQLEDDFYKVLDMLASIIEVKDVYTANHSENVKEISVAIAEAMELSDAQKKEIMIAASLHDIGKVGVSDTIINKCGALLQHEYEVIKSHPVIGEKILSKISSFVNVMKYVRHHHERFDGKGYPDGLEGENIPLGARIIAVADSYEAMSSDRPYRKALQREDIIRELKRCSGTQFDPKILELFLDKLSSGKI